MNFKGELVGIDAASRALFQKEAHGLNEVESSIIVSFFKSPSGKESRIAERACYIAREQEKELDCDKIKVKVREIFSRTYYIKPRNGFTYHIAHELNQAGVQELKTTLDKDIQIFSQEILRQPDSTGCAAVGLGSDGELSAKQEGQRRNRGRWLVVGAQDFAL